MAVTNKKQKEAKYEIVSTEKTVSGYGKRHTQILLLFMCSGATSFIKGCLNIAILGMTDSSIHGESIETFPWPKSTQGLILSSSGWGDLLLQFPAGYIVCKYGSNKFLSYSIFLGGVFSLLTPLAAHVGDWKGVCFIRMCLGLSQVFIVPAIHTILGIWVPVSERNRLCNFVYAGMTIAFITGSPLSGYIATSSLGWPWIFYGYGMFAMVSGVAYYSFGSASPAEHKTISPEERAFILDSPGNEDNFQNKDVPWRAILTSKQVLSLIIAQTGALYGYCLMIGESPTFFKLALGIELQNSGFLSALPHIAGFSMTMLASCVFDYIHNKKYMSLTKIRKLANTLGMWGPATCLVALTCVPVENKFMAISTVVIILAVDAISATGFLLNHIDLSPRYAAMIISLALTFSDIGNICAPIITGFILKDPSDILQWRIVFLLTAAVYFIGNIPFLFLGSAEVQPWNSATPPEKIYNETKEEIEDLMTSKEKNLQDEQKMG